MRSRVSVSTCSAVSVISVLSSPSSIRDRAGPFADKHLARANVQSFRRLSKRKCGFGNVPMLRCMIKMDISAAFFKAFSEPERVETRQIQQGQEGRNKQAAHDGNRHRAPERRTRQR